MSANIFGDRFIGNRTPAWHKLGKVFDQPMKAEQATIEAGLDYQVDKVPLAAVYNTPFGDSLVPVPDRFALVRQPTSDDPQHRVFAFVSDIYGVVQNIDIAKALDVLVEEWPVETAGALGHGETVFYSLDAGITTVGGEEVHQYFLVTDTRDGKTSMRMAFTPVRVVCENTLVSGLGRATVLQNLTHVGNTTQLFEQRTRLLSGLAKAQSATLETFNRMAEAILSTEDIQAVIRSAYPIPEKPDKVALLEGLGEEGDELLDELYGELTSAQERWLYAVKRANDLQNAALINLLRLDDEIPQLANSAWLTWNSVVELEDHREGGDTMYASALWGARARAKIRAYNTALGKA